MERKEIEKYIYNELLSEQKGKKINSKTIKLFIRLFNILNRAEWRISSDGYYPYCSRCLREPPNGEMTNYCSYCGANMVQSKKNIEIQIKRWKEGI